MAKFKKFLIVAAVLLLTAHCSLLTASAATTILMKFPPGVSQFTNSLGNTVYPDANGNATVPLYLISNYLDGGFTFQPAITGLLTAGTNVSLSGAGTVASPYAISASGGGSMTWPAAPGVMVYGGFDTYGTSLTPPSGALVGTADTQTLTHKDLSDSTNTFPILNQNTSGTAAGFTGSLAGDVSGTQGSTSVTKINGVSLPTLAASTGALYDHNGILSLLTIPPLPLASGQWALMGGTATGSVGPANKATPLGADGVLEGDSANGNTYVYSTWTQVIAFLKGSLLSKDFSNASVIYLNSGGSNTVVSSATPTPVIGTNGMPWQYEITGQSGSCTIQVPTGTAVDGQEGVFRIVDNGTAQTLGCVTTAGGYDALTTVPGALPTATLGSTTHPLYLKFKFNGTSGLWDYVANSY
jgi:hypothetical protein